MKKWIYNITVIAILTLLSIGCNDFLTQEPEVSVTNTNFWKTEQDCESALNGLQMQFRTCFNDLNILDRDRGLPFDYMDEFWETACNNTPIWEPTDPQVQWNNEYRTVANANLLIDNLYRAEISEERRNYYLGEALAIRGYVYFYIIRTWGDAPLVVKSEDVGEKARVKWRELADFLIADLKKASDMLPHVDGLKDAKGARIVSKQYFGKETAQAVLAHVYAWIAGVNNEPELLKDGIRMCDSVISSNQYQLVSTPEDVCKTVMLGNSSEGILEMDFQNVYDEIRDDGICLASFCQKWPIDQLSTAATPRDMLRFNFSSVERLFPYKEDLRRESYFYKLDSTAKLPASTTQGAAYIVKWEGR